MPRPRGSHPAPRRELPLVGDPADPQGLTGLCRQFLHWSEVQGYSNETVRTRVGHLRQFLLWCSERGLQRASDITRPLLERYQRHLYHYVQRNGEPLSLRSQAQRLLSLRVLFRWLARQGRLLHNPASELQLPRCGRRLPKHVLSAEEAERVLVQPDLGTLTGVRDRAILESFYSTGIRRQELLALDLGDIDTQRGLLMVRQGKGRRDRLIPLGKRASSWIEKYLRDARPRLRSERSGEALFLTSEGERIAANELTKNTHRYVQNAELGKSGSCHLLRHTMATLMLENGADIRFIQEMLGHADLKATQLYTHVAIRKLQEVHAATHPAERPRSRGPLAEAAAEALAAQPELPAPEGALELRKQARRGTRRRARAGAEQQSLP